MGWGFPVEFICKFESLSILTSSVGVYGQFYIHLSSYLYFHNCHHIRLTLTSEWTLQVQLNKIVVRSVDLANSTTTFLRNWYARSVKESPINFAMPPILEIKKISDVTNVRKAGHTNALFA